MKMVIISHFRIPNSAPIKAKMMYSSASDAVKKALKEKMEEVQASELSDLSWANVLGKITKSG